MWDLTLSLGAAAVKGIKESALLVLVITMIELSGIFFTGNRLADLLARMDEFIPDFNVTDWKLVSMGPFMAFCCGERLSWLGLSWCYCLHSIDRLLFLFRGKDIKTLFWQAMRSVMNCC